MHIAQVLGACDGTLRYHLRGSADMINYARSRRWPRSSAAGSPTTNRSPIAKKRQGGNSRRKPGGPYPSSHRPPSAGRTAEGERPPGGKPEARGRGWARGGHGRVRPGQWVGVVTAIDLVWPAPVSLGW